MYSIAKVELSSVVNELLLVRSSVVIISVEMNSFLTFYGVMTENKVKSSIHEGLQQELLDALLEGDLKCFQRLLQHPAVNPFYKYGKPHFGTCLEISSRRRDHAEFVKELLGKVKPNINHIVPEPIHHAAGRGNVDVLELLLSDKRTRVNAQDSSGRTALHYAAKNFPEGEDSANYERCLQMLLQHPHVNVNCPNDKGFTPVHEAVHSPAGKAAVMAFLKHTRRALDFDSFKAHGRTARETILIRFPELESSLQKQSSGVVESMDIEECLKT